MIINLAVTLLFGSLGIYMLGTMVRDIMAMIKAPKGRKIEAYYTSAKGYSPLTGELGRKLKS